MIDEFELITAQEGLSASTFEALFQFLNRDSSSADDTTDVYTLTESPGSPALCTAYTSNDMNIIAQTVSRLQIAEQTSTKAILDGRVILNLDASYAGDAVSILARDGFVRLNNILSSDLCDKCLMSINTSLNDAILGGGGLYSETHETGFGNVYSRSNRWDMYLHDEGVLHESLAAMLSDPETVLSSFFHSLFHGEDAEFYEFSALISDEGASNQPIHPDTVFQDRCPLYTVFVALQDVDPAMGPTVFLPRTHNRASHTQIALDRAEKERFLGGCEYRRALLHTGDAVVMDSRAMHYGDGNASSRRVLMYFTLRNPQYNNRCTSIHSDSEVDADVNPEVDVDTALPKGSLFADLKLSLNELLSGVTSH